MIDVDDAATRYFCKLLADQQINGLAIRVRIVGAGSPQADCKLEFCEPEDVSAADVAIDMPGFTFFVDRQHTSYLQDASMSYAASDTGGQLTIRAPRLKGAVPGAEAPLIERVQFVLDAEINPGVASHGGKVSLIEVSADGVAVLRFGGGCQGCSQVDMTLKHGVEKTLLERIPELSAVRDVTDHTRGENPYM